MPELIELSLGLQTALTDPDLAASAVLDPGGAAHFEAELAAALDGPSGLSATAAEIGVHAVVVGSVLDVYRATDQALAGLLHDAEFAGGWLLDWHRHQLEYVTRR